MSSTVYSHINDSNNITDYVSMCVDPTGNYVEGAI